MEPRFKIARQHHKSMKLNAGNCYSSWKLVHEYFKRLDKFGHPITLTYKGLDKFQTPWGACVSVLIFLAMTWVILIIASQVVTQPFQRRTVVTELTDENLVLQDISSLFSIVNFDTIYSD